MREWITQNYNVRAKYVGPGQNDAVFVVEPGKTTQIPVFICASPLYAPDVQAATSARLRMGAYLGNTRACGVPPNVWRKMSEKADFAQPPADKLHTNERVVVLDKNWQTIE